MWQKSNLTWAESTLYTLPAFSEWVVTVSMLSITMSVFVRKAYDPNQYDLISSLTGGSDFSRRHAPNTTENWPWLIQWMPLLEHDSILTTCIPWSNQRKSEYEKDCFLVSAMQSRVHGTLKFVQWEVGLNRFHPVRYFFSEESWRS